MENNNSIQPQRSNPQNNFQEDNSQMYQGAEFSDQEDKIDPEVQVTKNKISKKFDFKDWVVAKWWLVLLLIFAIGLFSFGLWFYIQSNQEEVKIYNQVDGFIEGPKTIAASNSGEWEIKIENRNPVAIKDVEVNLSFDQKFSFQKALTRQSENLEGTKYYIQNIDAAGSDSSSVIIKIQGSLNGQINESAKMEGSFSYTPDTQEKTRKEENISLATLITGISAPELSIQIEPSKEEFQSGEEIETKIILENISEKNLEEIKLELTYPTDFDYISSSLSLPQSADKITKPTSSDNIWEISSIPRLQKVELTIKGKIFANQDGDKEFKAEIFVKDNQGQFQSLTQDINSVKILSRPISLDVLIQGKDAQKTFDPGERLTFVINLANQSNRSIRNVEVFANIKDPAGILDYSTLSYSGGDKGNLNNATIQWRGSGVPVLNELSPQSSYKLQYSIQVKEDLAFRNVGLNQDQYILEPSVEATGVEMDKVSQNGVVYKARGEMLFEQKAEKIRQDPGGDVYKVTWTLKNRQSKINGIRVETVSNIPRQQNFAETIAPSSQVSNLTFNENSGQIVWQFNELKAFAGLSNPTQSITFEMLLPSNQGSNKQELYSEIKLIGVDDFTGERYEIPFTAPRI